MVRASKKAERVQIAHPQGGTLTATIADGFVTALLDTKEGRECGLMLYDSEGNAILCRLTWDQLGTLQRNLNTRAIDIDPRHRRAN